MKTPSESSSLKDSESCPALFWLISFVLALALAGCFLLVCCCLLGGRYYKEEAKKNAKDFTQCLRHQAELWKQERERWETEYKLRLDEQKHKNAAWDQNSELREDMDDLMGENGALRDQMDKLYHRNEQLEQESKRLEMENAGLQVRMAQARRPGQEAQPDSKLGLQPEPGPEPEREPEREPEPERPRNKVRFSSTLIDSGLPPGTDLNLEEPVETVPDSPQSHASFPSAWSGSEPGTPTRAALPSSPSDNGQDSHTSNLMSGMVTLGGLLPGPKQRNTWAAHSESPPEDDEWKPVSPNQHRSSVA